MRRHGVGPGFKRHYIQAARARNLAISSHSGGLWAPLLANLAPARQEEAEGPNRGRKPLARDFNLRKHIFPKFRGQG